MKIGPLLQQPYPLVTTYASILKTSLFFGGLVFLVLFIFQPFNISLFDTGKVFVISLYYGMISFSMIILNFIIFFRLQPWFNEKNWTLKKDLMWSAYMFIVIALANYTFTWYYFHLNIPFFSAYGVFRTIYTTIAVGFVPYAAATLLQQNQHYREHYKKALELNEHISKSQIQESASDNFSLSIESGREVLTIEAENIVAVEAIENYVNVYYVFEGSVQKKMMRNTLSQIEQQLSESNEFYRCHRSFIVNVSKIKSVEGNSQGYRLSLEGLEEPIPVSRNKIAAFNAKMKAMRMVA